MKSRIFTIPTIFCSFVLVFTLLTYQVFSYNQPSPDNVDATPPITLIFPDQEYVIARKDLETDDKELVIPTLDNATPKITYNQQIGMLESVISPQDYVVDLEVLRVKVGELGNENSRLTPTYVLRDRYTTSLDVYNSQLNQAYRNPLSISLKDGGSLVELTLDSTLLRYIIRPISTDSVHPLDVDKEALLGYIEERLTPKQKKYFNPTVAYNNTKNALNSRFMGNSTPLVLGVDDGPTSRGELANKYLEVDLSQQKMYFFIGHTLYKEYKISTGYEYPTPVGEFHILNKEPKAFSKIYNVWMPYWMAFKYAGDVGAYLGLHEIAYASLDKKGKPVYNHGYYIGDMMTGGCVAMEPKDSREIYNLSEVGMLVRIVK